MRRKKGENGGDGWINSDALLILVNCYVQIKKTDGFLIDGTLEHVWDDAVQFSDRKDKKIRIIALSEIAEVRQIDRGLYR